MKKRMKHKNITAILILILFSIVLMVFSYGRIYNYTQERSLKRMEEGVNTVVSEVSAKLTRDSRILNAVDDIISAGDNFDTESFLMAMNIFSPLMETQSIRILMPDNKIINPDGTIMDGNGGISFEDEAKLGEHVSNRMISVVDDNLMVIRQFVPIIKEGQTVALLYSVTDLARLPESINIDNIYNADADVFIIDMDNGDFIMDTYHKVLGNISEFEGMKTKDGANWSDKIKELMNGNKGYVTYKSEDGEWQYLYYAPAGINSWSIGVQVAEKNAFTNLFRIRNVLIISVIVELLAMIIYYIWVLKNTKETLEKAVLEEKLKKAEAAERAKSMFLSNMSHDIRTPMNAIIGFTTLAIANIDDKEKVKDCHSKILTSSNHLLSLINDVLDMSRIESGKLHIEEVACNLADVFRDMRTVLLGQMQNKQLDFFMDTIDVIDEDIYCDRLHLNQVLLNLLSNAMKFTPAGGSVALTVRQKSEAPTGYGAYEIRVKDTGIGMSPQFIEHVFEPFEREHNSTVSGIQGTGLGMAITKSIIDIMGGTIEVHSEIDKGTEYIINLKFRLQSEGNKIETIKELQGVHALVVDDDFNTCDSVTKMLVRLGLNAEWTMSGKEAVLRAKHAKEIGNEFYTYIIDWQLADLNGIETARQIRKVVGDNVPIIILTAYDWSIIEEEAKAAGVKLFCAKPIFISELRDTLLTAIGKNEKEHEIKEQLVLEEMKGKRILVVEDNELNREIATEILMESGIEVKTANDGTVAVEMVKESEPGYYDLILMDVQMPVMDGYEATGKIRSIENPELANIPIVAMTANAFEEDKKEAIKAGMNAHIAKPLELDKLFDTLREILGN